MAYNIGAMEKLLIVDDNDEIRKQLKWGLGMEYAISLAADRKEAISAFKKHLPLVMTLDLGLPPDEDGVEEGFRCLEEVLQLQPTVKVIVITGKDERTHALRAVQAGAYDYYQKPVELKELKVIIRRALNLSAIEDENRRLHSELERQSFSQGSMIGQCPEMAKVFSTIRKVAASDIPVLIQGESGTGKELVARAIHSASLRKDLSFIPINCGAIPESLLESELFGHEKGAFTGAQTMVQGKVEYAHKGTLFLDEIGELPAHLQVKLLRFLQEKTIQRVGGREDIIIDARIIAATNVDITKAIQESRFREDLYYRLGVIVITLPPLRERGDDVLILSRYFLQKFRESSSRKIKGFSAASMELLKSFLWPGNVRELENRIQRAVIMADSSFIEPLDLGFEAGNAKRDSECVTLKQARDNVEREMLISALNRNGGNIVKAALELDVSRPTLYDLMKKHGMNHPLEK